MNPILLELPTLRGPERKQQLLLYSHTRNRPYTRNAPDREHALKSMNLPRILLPKIHLNFPFPFSQFKYPPFGFPSLTTPPPTETN